LFWLPKLEQSPLQFYIFHPTFLDFLPLPFHPSTSTLNTLISPGLSSTTHIINPILTLLLDQIRSSFELLSQWNFAGFFSSVGKVIGQNHFVDVYTGDSSFDAFGEDFGDEFVCAVEDDLDSVVDFFLDCCEAVVGGGC
jgi:hypothetical protein